MAILGMRIEGMSGLLHQLRNLPDHVEEHAMDAALNVGSELIVKDAKARAPSDTGALRASLTVRSPKRKAPREIVQIVGPDPDFRGPQGRRPANYAQFLEFGTGPQRLGIGGIELKIRAAEKLLGALGLITPIAHRGMAARPFLRPAFDTMKDKAVDRVGQDLNRRIEREVKAQHGRA